MYFDACLQDAGKDRVCRGFYGLGFKGVFDGGITVLVILVWGVDSCLGRREIEPIGELGGVGRVLAVVANIVDIEAFQDCQQGRLGLRTVVLALRTKRLTKEICF